MANLAFVESLRLIINEEGLLYSNLFPKVFSNLKLNYPKHLGNILKKIKTQALKATNGNNTTALLLEVSDFAKKPNHIGVCCEAAGITVPWLHNSSEPTNVSVSNQMAIELKSYKQSSSMSWHDLANLWPRLFPSCIKEEKGRVLQRFTGMSTSNSYQTIL